MGCDILVLRSLTFMIVFSFLFQCLMHFLYSLFLGGRLGESSVPVQFSHRPFFREKCE
ncbi:hypothetical protein L873DRAFT_68902 [Choiromyces venosus 120613-1]|uniref:Uncharacterized protein n=1 Tax=Choiromyces venosus 120613-1 TaxID=1336337 RepID=A0A3N4J4P7_9PEZI|nr:hypothetical protein L873DRAFT_68902 [Choiromyces venosus 120613-1]